MIFQIGLENNVEGRTQSWALEHPGCFAYGADGPAALAAMLEAIAEYTEWVASRSAEKSWIGAQESELAVVETWEVYSIDDDFNLADEGYEVNAWFKHDWRFLTAQDIERGLKLLEWSRVDLLNSVQNLSQKDMEVKRPGERWNIAGILNHVGGAEWWYLDRLGLAFPQQQVPDDPFERLEIVRERLVEILPDLVGSGQVVGIDGEFWSPRKLLRRAVWHERDHTQHIIKLTG